MAREIQFDKPCKECGKTIRWDDPDKLETPTEKDPKAVTCGECLDKAKSEGKDR